MDKIMLQLQQVTGVDGKFRLSDISFALPAGYMMALVGKNGAGKTTLMDYIVNPKCRYQGNILLEGVDIRENHNDMRDKIGFVSENNHFFMERTAKQNAELLGLLYQDFQMDIFLGALKRMELAVTKTVGKMSRGEYMRFQMAFAMAHRPVLYLMDEVTAGMDPVFRLDFFKLLHEVIAEEKASVLLSTHLEEEIHRNMDYVGVLEKGKLVSFGEQLKGGDVDERTDKGF